MVFVGETRPQFNPTCVPQSNMVAISLVVIILDGVILAMIAIQAITSPSKANKDGSDHGRAVGFVIAGLAIWMGTSVTLLLGLDTLDLSFRTTVPAVGLFILVVIVIVLSGTLAVPHERSNMPPVSPTPQNMSRSLDLSTSDSNTTQVPPSRYEDVKGWGMMQDGATSDEMLQGSNYGLPTLARPITGVAGIGGVPLQGQLFPPLRSNPIESPNIKTRIDWPKTSKKGKPASGKLVISNPVIQDTPDMQNSLRKIPTIDLATAARNETERRAAYTQAQRSSALIAQRPAPRPPTMSSQDALKRATSITRKKVEPDAPPPLPRSGSTKTMKTTRSDESLSVQGNASSSSAQLSPGIEDLRRRSPRQVIPTATATKTPTFQPITPGQPIRIPIPKPPMPTESQPPKPVEPPVQPLQRRPTIGLPANPRAQAVRKQSQDSNDSSQQTVMLIKNIEYNDPGAVDKILQGVVKTPAESQSPNDRSSVVNRPRPIPRKGDKDRQVFPAEVAMSSDHRRTKSGGSISVRATMQPAIDELKSLPPLPLAPKSAGIVGRPQPNNTRSMTFDEKMTMLYKPEYSQGETRDNRKSIIPNLPTTSQPYLEPKMPAQPDRLAAPTAGGSISFDQNSIQTRSFLGVDDLFPAGNDRNAGDEFHDSWLPVTSAKETPVKKTNLETKRQSSPVIPAIRYSDMSVFSEVKSRGDDTTNWGSIHSPVAAVDMQGSRLNARSTYIRKDSERFNSMISGVGDEVMTVMLDTSSDDTSRRQSFYLEDDEIPPVPAVPPKSPRRNSQWHRRVGDECPTFSTRKDDSRTRKTSPPPPLTLNSPRKKMAIVIQPPEPSPLDSPEAAYQTIQAQLRKLGETGPGSAGSEVMRIARLENLELEMGLEESKWQSLQNDLGRNSIASVQTWTESRPVSTITGAAIPQVTLATATANRRVSQLSQLSSHQSLYQADGSLRPGEWWQARLSKAQVEYMDDAHDLILNRNNLGRLSVSMTDLGSPTPPDTDGSDMELEMRLQSISDRLHGTKNKVKQLWQPEAPAKQASTGLMWVAPARAALSINTVELPGLSVRPVMRKTSEPLTIKSDRLWQKAPETENATPIRGLWGSVYTELKSADATIADNSQKPSTRPLTQRPPRKKKRITMLPDILENPEPLPNKRDTLGIFQFPWGEKSENATVPVRTSQIPMAMPGTMTSGVPRAFIPALTNTPFEASEYSSSFFDDYEEEEEGDNFDGMDFEDSDDDDFDENTLWEIASLLKTEKIPSMDNLYASENSPSIVDNYIAEVAFEDGEYEDHASLPGVAAEQAVPVSTLIPTDFPTNTIRSSLWVGDATIQPLGHAYGLPQPEARVWATYIPDNNGLVRPRSRIEEIAPLQSREMWKSNSQVSLSLSQASLWVTPALSSSENSRFGLTQPSPSLWQAYLSSGSTFVRCQRRIEGTLQIETSSLWIPAAESAVDATEGRLWAAPKSKPAKRASPQLSLNLWEQPIDMPDREPKGLFDINCARSDYRRTTQPPAAVTMLVAPRKTDAPLSRLQSFEFWRPSLKQQIEINWIEVKIAASPSSSSSKPSLFKVDPTRKDYRSTDAEPAALGMISKPRRVEEPLAQLQSLHLWNSLDNTPIEFDWITMSSVRPQSPSVASVASTLSPPSSPLTDASSVKTSTTKASSIFAPIGFALGRLPFKKNKPDMSIPEIPESPNDASIPDSVGMNEIRDISAPERSTSRINASNQDWEEALQEAIRASHIKPQISRKPTSPKEWSQALAQAIAASYPKDRLSRGQLLPARLDAELLQAIARSQRPAFDVSKRHPVFAASSLTSQASDIHPAAIGYTHDVATTHPVFFGSQNISGAQVHPAMSDMAKQATESTTTLDLGGLSTWPSPQTTPTSDAEGGGHSEREIYPRPASRFGSLSDSMKNRLSRF
ncbi:hypothetical protein BX600DRAFT_461697, partial [Xylariales sp. PMI_506]